MPPRPLALAAAGVALLCVGALLLVAPPAPAPPQAVVSSGDAIIGDAIVVCGSIQHRPWSKTIESWNAGGADYYTIVLDSVYAARADLAGFGGSLIMRTPADASVGSDFAQWAGKHACVKGTLAESQPYVQQNPWEQFPVGANGQPLPRGSGIVVLAVGRLKDVK
jgi:hypothetical protein